MTATRSRILFNLKILVSVCIAFLMFFPFLWMLLSSVTPTDQLFQATFHLLPSQFTFGHYITAFQIAPWPRYFWNSLFTSVVITAGQTIIAAMAGYAFARLRFPLRGVLFTFLLTGLMVPGEVTLVPLFLLMKHFPLAGGNNFWGGGGSGLINSYGGLIVPGLVSIFGVFLLRQFFSTIPYSMDEAARIDGCGEFRLFWQVMLPLVVPALVTVAIFAFTGAWDNFLWPLIVLNNSNMFTVQLALAQLSGGPSGPTDWGALLAASVFVTVPIFIVFGLLQRYFLEGIALTGVKG